MSAPSTRGQRGGYQARAGRAVPASASRGRGTPRAASRSSSPARGRGRGAPRGGNGPSSGGDGLLQRLREGTAKRDTNAGGAGRGSAPPTSAPSTPGPRAAGRGRGLVTAPHHGPNNATSRDDSTPTPNHRDLMTAAFAKFQELKKTREQGRIQAIRDGFLADPEKKTSLDKAITPVGTCTEMCPQFERIERIVQNMVDKAEKVRDVTSGKDVPSEDLMVKRFRRSAAGYDEQLPSDIRTPATLKRTLDYLLDKVIGGEERLASVHKFVWDRTRGIRNDFSIQQVTNADDVRVAVDCYERIARFHILSLHQLANPDNLLDGEHFDAHQEREQLNNTLLSLLYYYDDNRRHVAFPNEGEFRAYCIIFELQSQHPDLEDRVQSWPGDLLRDKRIQTALKLYNSAGNTLFDQGPLRPLEPFAIAQANTASFWQVLSSGAVPYIMACVAEIYLGHIRFTALDALWRSCKSAPLAQQAKSRDWTLAEIAGFLGFDTTDETKEFCAAFGLAFSVDEHGEDCLDVTSRSAPALDHSQIPAQQSFSQTFVEKKRYRRTLAAVINGCSVSEAVRKGLVDPADELETSEGDGAEDDQSIFVPESTAPRLFATPPAATSFVAPGLAATRPEKDKNVSTNPASPPTFPPAAGFGDSILRRSNPFGAKTDGFGPSTKVGETFGQPFAFAKPQNAFTSTNFSPAPQQTSFAGKGVVTPSPFGTPSFPHQQPPTLPPSTIFQTSPRSDLVDKAPFSSPSQPPSQSAFNFKIDANSPPEQRSRPVSQPSISFPDSFRAQPKPDTDSSPFRSPAFASAAPPATQITSQVKPLDTAASPGGLNPNAAFSLPPAPKVSDAGTSQGPLQSPLVKASEAVPTHSSAPRFFAPSNPPAPTFLASKEPPKPDLFVKSSPPAGTPHFAQQPASSSKSPSPLSGTPAQASGPASPPAPQLTNSRASTAETPPSKPLSVQGQLEVKSDSKQINRARLVDAVAQVALIRPRGLLEAYVEHTLPDLVRTAFNQHRLEVHDAAVASIRQRILARKFGLIWRSIAWRLILSKRARNRRQLFAETMRVEEHRKVQGQEELEDILHAAQETKRLQNEIRNAAALTAASTPEHPPGQAAGRKRSVSGQNGKASVRETGMAQRHKRSRTLGPSSELPLSPTNEGPARRPHLSIFSASVPHPGGRDSATRHKLDTTRTDYFRLKALGIDPEASIVPHTKESLAIRRRREEEERARIVQPPRTRPLNDTSSAMSSPHSALSPAPGTTASPHSPSATKSSVTSPTSKDPPEDDFLAQIRAARNAFAEQEAWFKEQTVALGRQIETAEASVQIKRSSQGVAARPMTGVPKVNGHAYHAAETQYGTPMSRTEARIRATGAHGLATKPLRRSSDYTPVAMSKSSASRYMGGAEGANSPRKRLYDNMESSVRPADSSRDAGPRACKRPRSIAGQMRHEEPDPRPHAPPNQDRLEHFQYSSSVEDEQAAAFDDRPSVGRRRAQPHEYAPRLTMTHGKPNDEINGLHPSGEFGMEQDEEELLEDDDGEEEDIEDDQDDDDDASEDDGYDSSDDEYGHPDGLVRSSMPPTHSHVSRAASSAPGGSIDDALVLSDSD